MLKRDFVENYQEATFVTEKMRKVDCENVQTQAASLPKRKLRHDDYTVGWICPLEVEQVAALEMLDENHEHLPQPPTDHNVYNLGSIAGHNVVIAGLYQPVNNPAATVITQMRTTFPNLRFGLLVGIGGGVPVKTDNGMIRLGDVVVSKPEGGHSGAVQYDHEKAKAGHFEHTGALAPPPAVLLNAAQDLAAKRARSRRDPIRENIKRVRRYKHPGVGQDHLYKPDYTHLKPGASCDECGCDPSQRVHQSTNDENDEPYIVAHRGMIASGKLVVKNAVVRDQLAREHDVLCFETEAADVPPGFPCMVIRGISDYCDSHMNDQWHGYAAAAAAAYARQLFFYMSIDEVKRHDVANSVCSECNQTNFDQILNSVADISDRYGITVAQLGNKPEKGERANCYICRFFSALRLPAKVPSEYHLRALSAYQSHTDFNSARIPRSLSGKGNVFFVVLPGKEHYRGSWDSVLKHCREFGFICRTSPSVKESGEEIWGRVVPSSVNYGIYNEWLSFCRSNHKDDCKPERLQLGKAFRLIDCQNHSIVAARYGAQYAALSYVWGHPSRKNLPRLTLPAELPKTIEDAILVTQNLGIQYLWVDQYCINQDNHNEKIEQINAMGDIYRGAEITLIAGYGEDDNAGLPGVSKVLRQQLSVQIGNTKLVSTLRLPARTIGASKWNTRAWTYQEAVLSKRRLVFTKEQAYYECRGIYYYESLYFPLRVLHTKNVKKFRRFVHPGMFCGEGIFSAGRRGELSRVRDHIHEYTGRSLSHDEDSLYALLGVLNDFRDTSRQIYHFWGLPVVYGVPGITNHSLVSSLSWSQSVGARRRPSFPSWSWAGWEGEVYPGAIVFPTDINVEPHISLEKENGSLLSLEECNLRTWDPESKVFSKTLHLEAYFLSPDALPSELSYFDKKRDCKTCLWGRTTWLRLSVPIRDGNTFLTNVRSRDWECVYLGCAEWDLLFSFMIVQWRGKTAEKVGVMLVQNSKESKDAIIPVLSKDKRHIILV